MLPECCCLENNKDEGRHTPCSGHLAATNVLSWKCVIVYAESSGKVKAHPLVAPSAAYVAIVLHILHSHNLIRECLMAKQQNERSDQMLCQVIVAKVHRTIAPIHQSWSAWPDVQR